MENLHIFFTSKNSFGLILKVKVRVCNVSVYMYRYLLADTSIQRDNNKRIETADSLRLISQF